MSATLLIRYGSIPEVGRFAQHTDPPPERGSRVVVQSHRGPQLGTVLQVLNPPRAASPPEDEMLDPVLRPATDEDDRTHATLCREAQRDFELWRRRIAEWKLDLELIDLEWTLDRQKLILYVLGGRGADTTRLALQAAAQGLAVIEVQPVTAEGAVPMPSAAGGGCGSGGECGCHS
ncbi:MAG: PSP1 C-terminal domain-containing protein [Planctomycetales bacterium]